MLLGSRKATAWNLTFEEDLGPVLPGDPTNWKGKVEVSPTRDNDRFPEFFEKTGTEDEKEAACFVRD